ncbi:MAG: hypothetical protein IPL25_15630 [Saprospiraceae bacterium]|nr:hypothetical protein [Candidatus Vicinibacter affinis]
MVIFISLHNFPPPGIAEGAPQEIVSRSGEVQDSRVSTIYFGVVRHLF